MDPREDFWLHGPDGPTHWVPWYIGWEQCKGCYDCIDWDTEHHDSTEPQQPPPATQ